MPDSPAKDDQASAGETQARYPEGYWDDTAEYLRDCFILQHNRDYLEFLVKQVWKLDQACRLAEFGCGSGKMGLQLLPWLARGSSYTGLDQSATLIARGRQFWTGTPWPADFRRASIYRAPFPANAFDVTLIHTVLMHVSRPDRVLREMVRVTRPGGWVIACEANRNAHTAMLHIVSGDDAAGAVPDHESRNPAANRRRPQHRRQTAGTDAPVRPQKYPDPGLRCSPLSISPPGHGGQASPVQSDL